MIRAHFLSSMLFLALTTQTPCGLGILLGVVTTPHETCTRSSYLSTVNRLPVHQPETSRTWVTGMMRHTRSYLSHKILLVKCEEVPGDLKNNMGNVYMWPSEFARMWKRVSDFWSVMWGHFNNGFACKYFACNLNQQTLLIIIHRIYI
jgi:hypothetical protein